MRFIESILFKDGVYYNLALHQARVNRVFDKYASESLPHQLTKILPDLKMEGVFKVRMVYDMDSEDATYDLEYSAYYPRKIASLEVVETQPFDYSFKYEDRKGINSLKDSSSADDIIISVDQFVTDGSYFNLAFFDGEDWYTPDTPLLRGVRRAQLLGEGRIKERTIYTKDIHSYEKVSLINAMLDLGELVLPTTAVKLPPKTDA